MSPSTTKAFAPLAGAALIGCFAGTAHGQTIETVALSGQSRPGVTGTLAGFGLARINEAGDLAMRVGFELDPPLIETENNSAIVRITGATWDQLMREGDRVRVPDPLRPGEFREQQIQSTIAPAGFGPGGSVLVFASFNDWPRDCTGVWRYDSAGRTLLAARGSTAVGIPGATHSCSISPQGVDLLGNHWFADRTQSPPTQGVWRNSGSGNMLFVAEGGSAVTPTGGIIESASPHFGRSGQVALSVTLEHDDLLGIDEFNDDYVWFQRPGQTPEVILSEGDEALGLPSGLFVGPQPHVDVGRNGQVFGLLTASSSGGTDTAIWRFGGDVWERVVGVGDTTPSGRVIRQITTTLRIGREDEVVFACAFERPPFGNGLYRYVNNTGATILERGDPAPGLAGQEVDLISGFWVNRHGDILCTFVTDSGQTGLSAFPAATREHTLLIATGVPFDVDRSATGQDLRVPVGFEVSGTGSGLNDALTDSGLVVFTAAFEGSPSNTAGVFRVRLPQAAPCQPDLDLDGELTIFDFLAFQNLFDAGDPRADFDGDGSLTIFDFLAFQNAFDAGCP